jgi:hypothetical protein
VPPGDATVSAAGGVGSATRFAAEVAVDLTDVRRRAVDEHHVMAHIVVCLLAACHGHHLISDRTRLQVLSPTSTGWMGVSFDQAVRQSAFGIATGLSDATSVVPDDDAGALRLVRLDGSGVRASSDWGLSGLGTITVSAATPVARPWEQEGAGGFSIVTRWRARVGMAMGHSSESARAVVSALAEAERTIRVVED